jgi:hypothetical protein
MPAKKQSLYSIHIAHYGTAADVGGWRLPASRLKMHRRDRTRNKRMHRRDRTRNKRKESCRHNIEEGM